MQTPAVPLVQVPPSFCTGLLSPTSPLIELLQPYAPTIALVQAGVSVLVSSGILPVLDCSFKSATCMLTVMLARPGALFGRCKTHDGLVVVRSAVQVAAPTGG